ncbi:tetratricopeptide repeat protein [Pedosphaera parvula]|uniref:Tetratricopeptide TPR_2 repeat protein n=1 Tax=Pedosphaera parvula (strain Ellin514) TaxID=320771 RepID=B9XAC5_PEDPL|nr:tetratricopeptide repeat protein [Pedosphaera parvula]EEF63466.1 Tetratricopeptide TPR_2 repeat protein [Pedosphaera parvula Ellin514]
MTGRLRKDLPIGLLLATITFVAYYGVLHAGFNNYDDSQYLTENPAIKAGLTAESVEWAFTTGYAGNWHPLTWLSHMLDWQLFGAQAGPHHLISLLFHIANSVLLFVLLRSMTGALWRSAIVAAIFAWHPVHVESVAWVAERKDVLSTFFWLLTLLAYVAYARRGGWLRYCLVVVCFVLGLMSKPMVVTLPLILFLMDFWPLERIKIGTFWKTMSSSGSTSGNWYPAEWKRLVLEKLPLLILAGISSWITLEVQVGGGAVSLTNLTLSDRIQNALVSYVRYLGKLFWPRKLAVFYPYHYGWSFWQVGAAALLIASLLLLAIYKMRRSPFLITGWLWYLIAMVPVIGLIQVGEQSIADRYTYIPSIGLFVAVVWGVLELFSSLPLRNWILGTGTSLLLSACVVCTIIQVSYWKTSETLFSHALEATKDNVVAEYNLGQALSTAGKMDAAVPHYREALRIQPNHARAQNNLGLALYMAGKAEEATHHYSEALKIDPNAEEFHFNYGLALASLGRVDEAIEQHSECARLMPEHAENHFTLASLLVRKQQFEPAVLEYSETIKYKPEHVGAHLGLALVLNQLGRIPIAVEQYEETLRLSPNVVIALNNLAWIYSTHPDQSVRNGGRAVELARHACELTENQQPVLLGTLGAALAEAGQFKQAVEAAKKAQAMAEAAKMPDIAEKNAKLEKLYVSEKPFREEMALLSNSQEAANH